VQVSQELVPENTTTPADRALRRLAFDDGYLMVGARRGFIRIAK